MARTKRSKRGGEDSVLYLSPALYEVLTDAASRLSLDADYFGHDDCRIARRIFAIVRDQRVQIIPSRFDWQDIRAYRA